MTVQQAFTVISQYVIVEHEDPELETLRRQVAELKAAAGKYVSDLRDEDKDSSDAEDFIDIQRKRRDMERRNPVVRMRLNGNQGSATNTDDHADKMADPDALPRELKADLLLLRQEVAKLRSKIENAEFKLAKKVPNAESIHGKLLDTIDKVSSQIESSYIIASHFSSPTDDPDKRPTPELCIWPGCTDKPVGGKHWHCALHSGSSSTSRTFFCPEFKRPESSSFIRSCHKPFILDPVPPPYQQEHIQQWSYDAVAGRAVPMPHGPATEQVHELSIKFANVLHQFGEDHEVAPQINGANGEHTGLDDIPSRLCGDSKCHRTRHTHLAKRKHGPPRKPGADQRLAITSMIQGAPCYIDEEKKTYTPLIDGVCMIGVEGPHYHGVSDLTIGTDGHVRFKTHDGIVSFPGVAKDAAEVLQDYVEDSKRPNLKVVNTLIKAVQNEVKIDMTRDKKPTTPLEIKEICHFSEAKTNPVQPERLTALPDFPEGKHLVEIKRQELKAPATTAVPSDVKTLPIYQEYKTVEPDGKDPIAVAPHPAPSGVFQPQIGVPFPKGMMCAKDDCNCESCKVELICDCGSFLSECCCPPTLDFETDQAVRDFAHSVGVIDRFYQTDMPEEAGLCAPASSPKGKGLSIIPHNNGTLITEVEMLMGNHWVMPPDRACSLKALKEATPPPQPRPIVAPTAAPVVVPTDSIDGCEYNHAAEMRHPTRWVNIHYTCEAQQLSLLRRVALWIGAKLPFVHETHSVVLNSEVPLAAVRARRAYVPRLRFGFTKNDAIGDGPTLFTESDQEPKTVHHIPKEYKTVVWSQIFTELEEWMTDSSNELIKGLCTGKILLDSNFDEVTIQTSLMARIAFAARSFNGANGRDHMVLVRQSPLHFTNTLIYIMQSAIITAIGINAASMSKTRLAFPVSGQHQSAPTLLAPSVSA